jgi:hypothetical protein
MKLFTLLIIITSIIVSPYTLYSSFQVQGVNPMFHKEFYYAAEKQFESKVQKVL